MGFLDTVKNLVSKNADKVETAIDKVGDVVDKKTQGKYASHVDKAQVAAKKAVDGTKAGGQVQGGQVPPTQSGQVPPTQQSGHVPPANEPPTAPPTS